MRDIVVTSRIPPIDMAAPSLMETATFALGCFWDPDSRFGVLDGVVHTRVGYSGGKKSNPTYHDLGDHTETIQIDYDPTSVSYQRLLEVFWQSHEPVTAPWSRQYKSIIFYHNDEQKRLAIESKCREEARRGKLFTAIVPFARFYLAEDYHQKYRLRQIPDLEQEYTAIYPNTSDFVASTAAARVNGYLGGYGTPQSLRKELSSLGLSPSASRRLLDLVSSHGNNGGGYC